jgi:hypothetical protein
MGGNVIFDNVSFGGRWGPNDIPMSAFCPKHGMVTVYVPRIVSGANTMMVSASSGDCPVEGCDQQAFIPNTFIDFQRAAIAALKDTKVSRQQARRFARAVEREDDSKVRRVAGEISPKVAALVDIALKSNFRQKGIALVSWLLAALAAAGLFYNEVMTGLEANLRIIEEAGSVQEAVEIALSGLAEQDTPDVADAVSDDIEDLPQQDQNDGQTGEPAKKAP